MGSGKRILVVDDQQDVLDLLSVRLRSAGFRIDTVNDGAAAVAAVERDPPDLILLDLLLPDLNGFQICRAVREKHPADKLPILIVSAKAEPADRYWAEQVGANGFLEKPFDLRDLISDIEGLLAGGSR